MARPLRLEVEDGIYHLTARGNERAMIFRDDPDRERFLEILAGTHRRFGWRCLAYCLMCNRGQVSDVAHRVGRQQASNGVKGRQQLAELGRRV